jgi:uncharacterized SAM-dependent methyltransferase
VKIGNEKILFEENEPVFMEISQKYSLQQINETSSSCGFERIETFFDKNKYFVDVLWKAV